MAALLSQYEARRDSFSYAEGEALPPLDLDLAPMADQIVADPQDDPVLGPPFRSSYHRKCFQLREELQGQSELVFLNGLLIAHLRKRSYPDHAPTLFQRLWAEHGAHLLAHLNQRWLVSAVTTFGDHGTTPAQRSVGLSLTALFGMMKLYESERLHSGQPPEKPFTLEKTRAPLPMEMDAYSITNGGLDVNLLARLWQEAEGDQVIAPLAHHLLDLLIHDDRTLFRRLQTMRTRKLKQIAAKTNKRSNIAPVPVDRLHLTPQSLRWGLVSTIRAPLPQIARWAAHHLELGADALHIYLDEPNASTAGFLKQNPRVHVTLCDDTYWQNSGKRRMDQHQLRQAFNATRTLRASEADLDWLGHIDVDEFLIAQNPVNEILAAMPPATAAARVSPAECLAPEHGQPRHFKFSHKYAGLKKAILQEVYPTFGLHLYGGFLSHTSGKVFARTGIPDTRLGIHALKMHKEEVSNRHRPPGIWLAHFHAPSWEHFRSHLEFRRTRGSYRKRNERPELGQSELFDFLMEEEGDEGLRAFFEEVCADTPELRERLSEHNMLLTHDFDFDGAVHRVFGRLP
ncbi:glycosyltransferase family 2 protein [Tropicibacter naphthalenivorans]|uniref:Glycosyl transferase family 2 n=1 Tax=Tropicibacter naphthalenivorans TaxID=441103 RepID=A0A0P1GF42_9RHOB|nr:glycosyltransferase family 2 protein [Tropicibacter naphthalenivorans]CUH80338.1 hypothetical protein TRN7648_02936 [Tropicibacter naphthalenivorans]SMC85909.1 Glycosyl transferase family 2 [Tropicibacter naphthalenivorans]